MDYQQFLAIKDQFDNGLVDFNHGAEIDAFLFNNKWYPIRAFVHVAIPGINNHHAIKELVSLIPNLRVKQDMDFQNANGMPIPITEIERNQELKYIMQRLNDLIYI